MTPAETADAALRAWLGEIGLLANGNPSPIRNTLPHVFDAFREADDLDLATAELFDATPITGLLLVISEHTGMGTHVATPRDQTEGEAHA
jgi:hypothetical protein